ncbi:MAG: 30S ribosomal protein S2 [Ilumatobacteraceae bacterium]|mgnify:CR=1 FL=1
MAVVTMRQMLEAGVHFGHQTRRWNPKMKRFIFGERNGIYIIDLEQTLSRVEAAYNFVRDLSAKGGTVLFIGTKKQAQDPVRSYAQQCGMHYVNERWLGGMLTNFETIAKRVGKMQEYERMKASGEFEAMPKKEALLLGRELEKLQKNLGGIRGMSKRPDAVFILDTKKEHIAVTEANKLKIPVIAVVDTNVDPDVVQYPIPGNDDAIRANALMSRVIAEAVAEGRYISNKRNPQVEAAPKRSAEDEAAFAAAQADARRQAAAAQAARDAKVAAAKAERAEAEAADEAAAATDSASVEAAAEEAPAADVQPLADLGGAAEAGTAADAGADSAADAAPYAGAVRATGTEAPEGHTIKGNADSGLFHTTESPYYGRTKAEFWFDTEDNATAAGFTRWDRKQTPES